MKQKHPITRLLTAALISEYIGLLFTSIHYGLFAINGEGIQAFNSLGDVMEIFSQVNMVFKQSKYLCCKISVMSILNNLKNTTLLIISVSVHATVNLAFNGVGRYKTGIDLQNRAVLTLVSVYNCPLPFIHLEKGKRDTISIGL